MRSRAILTILLATAISLSSLAGPALAKLSGDGGEGAYGKTDDVVITNFGFGLIIFFAAFVSLMSLGQYLLDRRKRSR